MAAPGGSRTVPATIHASHSPKGKGNLKKKIKSEKRHRNHLVRRISDLFRGSHNSKEKSDQGKEKSPLPEVSADSAAVLPVSPSTSNALHLLPFTTEASKSVEKVDGSHAPVTSKKKNVHKSPKNKSRPPSAKSANQSPGPANQPVPSAPPEQISPPASVSQPPPQVPINWPLPPETSPSNTIAQTHLSFPTMTNEPHDAGYLESPDFYHSTDDDLHNADDSQAHKSCLEPCVQPESDSNSVTSRSLCEAPPIFDSSKQYAHEELLHIIDSLVIGINNRESLRSRYDEEAARLSINREFQLDKLHQNQNILECLRKNQTDVDGQLKDNQELLNRNHLQLAREKKRIEGAIGLQQDFDRELQQLMSVKSQMTNEYEEILKNLDNLLDDSNLQWIQRETMMSTESEALERLHHSVEKEHSQLQAEFDSYQCLHTTKSAQNQKLSTLVEQELEKYATKQHEVIKYNEKRIRALEGCVRTMQLDREVMYGETAENRHRLQEVINGRVTAFMSKVTRYRELLQAIKNEIHMLSYQPDTLVRVSHALSRYSQTAAELDMRELEEKVKLLKVACDRTEKCWKSKSNQKRDLTDIRKSYVEHQRQHMLNSEEDYFLMEPVDVPGINSNSNFQRSAEDLTKSTPEHSDDGVVDQGAFSVGNSLIHPRTNDIESIKSSKVTTDARKDFVNQNAVTEDVDQMQSTKPETRRQSVKSVAAQSKKAADAMGNAFRRLSMGIGIK